MSCLCSYRYCLQAFHLDRTMDSFSPLTACIALPCTVRRRSLQAISSSISLNLLSELYSVFNNMVSLPSVSERQPRAAVAIVCVILFDYLDQRFKKGNKQWKSWYAQRIVFLAAKDGHTVLIVKVYLRLRITSHLECRAYLLLFTVSPAAPTWADP